MIGRMMSFAMLAMVLSGAEALARGEHVTMPTAPQTVEPAAPSQIQLAQYRDVEMYYDRLGRRILVDPYTGEVVAIMDPSEEPIYRGRPPAPEVRPLYPPDDYYIAEPRDTVRERRQQRMRELGRAPLGEPLPEYRDYRALPEPVDPEYEDEYLFGDEPQWDEPEVIEPPQQAAREEIERMPLDDSASLAAPEGQPGNIIEIEPSAGALPDPTEPPEIDMSGTSEDVARFQILLDRVGASPGVIDGRIGDNVNKAIDVYRELTGETLRTYDKEYVRSALEETGGDAFTTYEITPEDAAGPYIASIPSDYGEKAKLQRMGYTSVVEMLAERFHMAEEYLMSLNPGVNFDRPGTIIRVANLSEPIDANVTRIVADKAKEQVRVYDEQDELVAVYPATIGSQSTPSPTGTHTVERIAFDPEYTYNPEINFQQGDNDEILTIPPGPNGPVGSIWIALSKPTYGIHGTPEPTKIGKTNSNGCIRLTNWDAQELAKMVEKGVTVEFVD